MYILIGETEFKERYTKPEQSPYSSFIINPQPDYTLPGRPLARLVPDSFSSEYTRRYVRYYEICLCFFTSHC
jgi:hypothetical protein